MATLGEQVVGSIVKLNVNGTATNFIVVHQGLPSSEYDSSCDGTWLLMEDLYESRAFDSSDHDYENSDIYSYLNNTFVNLFDSDIKSAIKQVKLPYRAGAGESTTVTSGSSGLSAKVFLPSYAELGFSSSGVPAEGAVLSYFNGAENSKRIARLNGTITAWWLRTPRPRTDTTNRAFTVTTTGGNTYLTITNLRGVRPTLVLPYELNVADDGLIDGSITSSGDISGGIKRNAGNVTINGAQKELTGVGYANIGGVWKELVKTYVNIDGVWKDANNVTISITQASTDTSHCYLQIGDTKYTTVQDIIVPSGTKVTFRVLSDYEMGGISVNGNWLYSETTSFDEYAYMDLTTNISVSFSCEGKYNYIYITTDDGKQYAYDTSTSYIVLAKTMTINGTPYAFKEGMTWGEWVNSSYNTGYNGSLFTASTSVSCNIIENGYDMCYQVSYDGYLQFNDDVIVEGREYGLRITNMGPA